MKGRALRVDTKAKRLQNNPEIAGYFGIPEDESWLQRRVRQRRRQDLQSKPAHSAGRQRWDVRRTTRLDLTPRAGLCSPQCHIMAPHFILLAPVEERHDQQADQEDAGHQVGR